MVAPVALSVVGLPEQTVVFPVTATVGEGLTVTVTVEVEEQALAVPVTVYVVVDEGVTVMLLPERLPGIQL